MLNHGHVPDELLDYSGVRAAIVRAHRTAAETPGSARLLDVELYLDNEFDLDKLLRLGRFLKLGHNLFLNSKYNALLRFDAD